MKSAPFLLGLKVAQPHSAFMDTSALYEAVGHNTGNLAFHFAISQHLGGDLTSIPWSAPTDAIDAAGDVAIVPCANQLGPHADFGGLGAKLSKLTIPIVAIGLGAQAGLDGRLPEVPEGTRRWVRAMAARSLGNANIGVRGDFTKAVLDHYDLGSMVEVIGCPTLFINPEPHLGRVIAGNICAPTKIAVASGNQGWRHLAAIEASLTAMVTCTNGSYVGQSPKEMVQITRGEAALMSETTLQDCIDYCCPGMSLDEFVVWSKKFGTVFFDVPSWMEHYRRHDFVVGTRIHGVMLALQAGVPSLCVAHDSRTVELCETMKVPYVLSKNVAAGIKRRDLMKLFAFDADGFDKNRSALCRRYVQFLKGNGVVPAKWLSTIANAA